MSLSSNDFAAISSALEKIYALQDLDGFIVSAMAALPPLIDSDSGGYNEVNYAKRRMLSVVNSPIIQRLHHQRQHMFEPILNQNPLIEYNASCDDEPKKISDFLTVKQWHATAIYQRYYRDAGTEHQMAVALSVDETAIVAFAFNRKESDFTERHRQILAFLQPHLTQAYKNAKAHGSARRNLEKGEQALEAMGAGWIELDGNLAITSATALARSNLEAFFDVLPTDVSRLPAELEAWLNENARDIHGGTPIAPFVITNELGRLTVRVLGGADGGQLSLLTERFINAPSSIPLEQLGLTERQAEVLYWVSQGKSNGEIAVILKISLRTVVFHVSKILEALGANNRTEAANIATTCLTSRNYDGGG